MLKRINVLVAAIVILLVLSAFMIPAFASTNDPCVPKDAWTETIVITAAVPEVPGTSTIPAVTAEQRTGWQRYSFNGPWESNTVAPPFPDERWQPNVKGDPHGVGVEGAYFRSHGNSGNGDWFYLEGIYETVVLVPEVPAVPGIPAIPAVTRIIEHAAVACTTPTVTPEVPVETPETETSTPTEEESPEPDPDKDGPNPSGTQVECVNGVWVTTVDGEKVGEAGSCERTSVTTTEPVPAQEEGL